jgi:hypothetical protein
MSEIISFDFHFYYPNPTKKVCQIFGCGGSFPQIVAQSMKQAAGDKTKTKNKIKVAKEEDL